MLITSVVIGIFLGYRYNEDLKNDAIELSFASEKMCEWHNEYNRIQIRFNEKTGRSILRKVNVYRRYVVYAYKKDNYSLSAWVKFITECKANTEIVTAKTYSNGEPITLKCNDDGDALAFSVVWEEKTDIDFVWNNNLGGFKFRVDFRDWDFTKLDQEITLSKAK